MFKVPKNFSLQQQVDNAERNYVIQKNDLLSLEVYTNKGERIVDPNSETLKESSSSAISSEKNKIVYLVDVSSKIKFPLIGEIQLETLTIKQAEELLQKEFSKYYEEPYVVLQFTNKRATVLGATGGQLVPLVNENIRLTEILALAKGIPQTGKARNIRVLRGDKIFVADLSTIDGYLKNNMIIEPGDIIYVEPVQRVVSEAIREYGPVFTILTSITTLIIVLTK
ncbi:MAG TPA: polysaccharide biosynthesis/export family protein [Cyclobacteriaceae bacterium]|jgi:polysaccharide export outer membrane protein|nr:polysaccharide biosynthesis/export family protein [Cyclobacteriaceae bacterium]